jgi:cell wall-associated NlpC family hydrolase
VPAIGLTAAVLVVAQGGAIAAPKPTIAQAKAKLKALEDKADQAVDRYNAANERWKKAKQKYDSLNGAYRKQQSKVDSLRVGIVNLAVSAYQRADTVVGFPAMSGMSSGGDPHSVLNGLAALNQISAERAGAVDGYESALGNLKGQWGKARTALSDADTERDDFRKQKTQVDRLVGEQERLLRRLGAFQVGNTNSSGVKYTGSASGNARGALQFAFAQVGKPYRYGGTGPGVWDCSGLTQAAWRSAGVSLPRTAAQQWAWGASRRVSMNALQPGDLLFSSGLGHVGMYAGNGKMVHAPRTGDVVKIVTLGSYGQGRFIGAIRP